MRPEQISSRPESTQPISVSELRQLVVIMEERLSSTEDKWEDEIKQIEEEIRSTKPDITQSELSDLHEAEFEKIDMKFDAQQQSLLSEFRTSLLERGEDFQNIFRTERGSTYFVLPSGESLRIKQDHQGIGETLEIHEEIFFVDDETASHFSKNKDTSFLNGQPINAHGCEIGINPLEINFHDSNDPIKVNKQGAEVVLNNMNRDNRLEIHIGHRITQVIK
jgi:hypothetical protein